MAVLIHFAQMIGQVTLWLAAIWSAVFCVYLGVLLVASFSTRRLLGLSPVRKVRRFLVLVPAHNEEAGIAQTVRSALTARVETVEVSVLVVADNYHDKTTEVAAAAGAEVICYRSSAHLRIVEVLGLRISSLE